MAGTRIPAHSEIHSKIFSVNTSHSPPRSPSSVALRHRTKRTLRLGGRSLSKFAGRLSAEQAHRRRQPPLIGFEIFSESALRLKPPLLYPQLMPLDWDLAGVEGARPPVRRPDGSLRVNSGRLARGPKK